VTQVFQLIDRSLSFARLFNSKSLNRMVLWKKGYFTNRDSLPSLHNFEINVLLAKFFYYRKNLSPENLAVVPFVTQTIRNFLEKSEVLEQAYYALKEGTQTLIVEDELNKEFKEKNFKEKQVSLLFMFDLLSEHLFPYLVRFPFEDFPFSDDVDVLIDALVDYLPRSNLAGIQKLKCLKCTECADCEKQSHRLKKEMGIEDLLKRLIKFKALSGHK
jgi:hypothetical protein